MRRAAAAISLLGLATIMGGGFITTLNSDAGMAVAFLIGVPLSVLGLLLSSTKKADHRGPQGRAERRFLGVCLLVSCCVFFPGLVLNAGWVMLFAAALPLVAAIRLAAAPLVAAEA